MTATHDHSRPSLRQPDVFGEIYRTHARSILVFLTRRIYDPEIALDLTAETFAQAFAGRRRFRGSTDEEIAAWLFGIARNVLARYLRRGRAERRALRRLGVDVPTWSSKRSNGWWSWLVSVRSVAPWPASFAPCPKRIARRCVYVWSRNCPMSLSRNGSQSPSPPPGRASLAVCALSVVRSTAR